MSAAVCRALCSGLCLGMLTLSQSPCASTAEVAVAVETSESEVADTLHEHPLLGLMKALPAYTIAAAVASPTPSEQLQTVMPGLHVLAHTRLYLDAQVLFSQGPRDGLESIACMPGGKNHESLLLLDCANGEMIKSMFIGHLNMLADGMPAREESGIPARGYPVRALLRWQPDPVLEPETWVERDISTMVRDRSTQHGYPALPYIYVGSRFETINTRDTFMLNMTKTVVTNFDEEDTLIASPYPLAQFDNLFEAYSRDMPMEESRVQLIFERAVVPLSVYVDAAGIIHVDEQPLDNDAFITLLQQHYPASFTGLRAIAVQRDADCPRAHDVELRSTFLQHAITAGVWVVPVFVPVEQR